MAPKPSQSLWSVQLGQPDQWRLAELGSKFAGGAAAGIYQIQGLADQGPLVAKIYSSKAILQGFENQDTAYFARLVALTSVFEALSQSIPFVAWPRHILFNTRNPANDAVYKHVVGFTMPKLDDVITLEAFFDGGGKVGRSMADILHLAKTIADQTDRLHRHAWGFAIGDFNQKNILFTTDLTRIYFVDADSFQCQPRDDLKYPMIGGVPAFSSPIRRSKPVFLGPPLHQAHDNFVLAIHLFSLLFLGASGDSSLYWHPFACGTHDERDLIAKRIFPLNDPAKYAVPANILAVYYRLPDYLRAAFNRNFTTPDTMTPGEWGPLLDRYGRDHAAQASVAAPLPPPRPAAPPARPTPPKQKVKVPSPTPAPMPAPGHSPTYPYASPSQPQPLGYPLPAPPSASWSVVTYVAIFAWAVLGLAIAGSLKSWISSPPRPVSATISQAELPPPQASSKPKDLQNEKLDPAKISFWAPVQQRLRALGLMHEPVSGVLDVATDRALQRLVTLAHLDMPKDAIEAQRALREFSNRIALTRRHAGQFPLPANPPALVLGTLTRWHLDQLAGFIRSTPMGQTKTYTLGDFPVRIKNAPQRARPNECSIITYTLLIPDTPQTVTLSHCWSHYDFKANDSSTTARTLYNSNGTRFEFQWTTPD